jgi:NAD(P)-dependent dehydrogenase (short-subunit alcohol dehydrogenase family)
MSGRLQGKVAMITGGAGGFGRALGTLFEAQGASIILTDIDGLSVDKAARELSGEGFRHDVANENEWQQIVHRIEEQYGRLDILVNNAGIEGNTRYVNPEDTALEDFKRVQAVNVEGTFLGCKSVIPVMRRGGGGSIINLSSIAGRLATPFQTAYGASKAAVKQLTMTVAAHCAKEGIRCNAIHPGQIRTRMIDAIYAGAADRLGLSSTRDAEQNFTDRIPMGHLGAPADIAYAALYLASEESAYVTGISLLVDGGMDIV